MGLRDWDRRPGKVTAEHCDRLAVVYVRQSTLRQVQENTESAKMQYALVERAAAIEWAPSRIVVIDEAMGHSAGGGQDRRSTAATPGSARPGSALLSGLVHCGRCGKRMTVGYRSEGTGQTQHIYRCEWEQAHYGGNRCQQLAGACLDQYLTKQVLAAMAPTSLDVSLTAFAQVEADRTALERIWAQRLERADYEADQARRRYRLTEPENRLVVRQLEAEREQALTGPRIVVRAARPVPGRRAQNPDRGATRRHPSARR